MTLIALTLALLVILILLVVLTARLTRDYSVADLLDWKPTRSPEVEAQNEIDDIQQMIDAQNEYRRKRGAKEITEADVAAPGARGPGGQGPRAGALRPGGGRTTSRRAGGAAEGARRKRAKRKVGGAGADRRLRLPRPGAGRELRERGWQVRGTSARAGLEAIEAAGLEAAVADPDRPGTVLELCGDVTVVVWLLGSARGEPELIAAIHGPRLERLLEKLVDSPVRGFVYEAAGPGEASSCAAAGRSSSGPRRPGGFRSWRWATLAKPTAGRSARAERGRRLGRRASSAPPRTRCRRPRPPEPSFSAAAARRGRLALGGLARSSARRRGCPRAGDRRCRARRTGRRDCGWGCARAVGSTTAPCRGTRRRGWSKAATAGVEPPTTSSDHGRRRRRRR